MDEPSLADYLASRAGRGVWLREPGLSLYVRRRSMRFPLVELVIANVRADEPGQGAFTRLLNTWEPELTILVENALEPRLRAYLERRGYESVGPDELPSYLRPKYA
jgi:hypothetical protein